MDGLVRAAQVRGPVCVEWVDASFDLDGPGLPPDAFDVQTYGWVTGTNTTFITVASELLPDGAYRCLTHIPQALIRRIVDLEEGDQP